MSREKNTDLTDCTDMGGAVRHCPPPVRQIRKIRNQKKKDFSLNIYITFWRTAQLDSKQQPCLIFQR